MKITLPELSLVVLVGASGAGKSSFASMHFKPTESLSSDFCRGLVSDDENNQAASDDAFAVLHFVAERRLSSGRLTVIDATNVQKQARKPLLDRARAQNVPAVAIVFNLPTKLCLERNAQRPERNFGPHVVQRQNRQLHQSLSELRREGFQHIFVLTSADEVTAATVERVPLWNNLRHEHGPFDIIGDVHGCYSELRALLARLGYEITEIKPPAEGEDQELTFKIKPPQGRKAVFLGDLVDRGPAIPAVLRLVMAMVESGAALCIPGNHDVKLFRQLSGRQVQITHGLADSIAQLALETPAFRARVSKFLEGLIGHYVLDEGRLVVAHAGLKETFQGRASRAVREFALYGETTGETDEFGLPIRYNWAAEYRGRAMVVYGHTPIPEPEWLNNTINIDTGCVFGGLLTALRYPEKELVAVPAERAYCDPVRPLIPVTTDAITSVAPLTAQQRHDEILNIEDVSGKRLIETSLRGKVMINEEHATAALEVMSRFAANPRWLIYLPPTMSPCETSKAPDLLEHPAEAFAYFRSEGIPRVICEEKHMGSRAVVIVCRDEAAARARFGVEGEGPGICYTRTGRRFFDDPLLERELLTRLQQAMTRTNFWERFETTWVCLDCELLPWSVKAQSLVLRQYAAVGAASRASLSASLTALEQAQARGVELESLLTATRERAQLAERYVAAYRHYCWPVNSLADLKLAPFHVLAIEKQVLSNKDHLWHMHTLAELCATDPELLLATPFLEVDVNDEASVKEGIVWWQALTATGGEGMVVKPLEFIVKSARGLVQPAVKCRGPEYLRIIYGPEYSVPQNLERLRQRGLGAKRSLALREFALGIEGLERFVRDEPLRRVHECSFGVLALESEPIDPRL